MINWTMMIDPRDADSPAYRSEGRIRQVKTPERQSIARRTRGIGATRLAVAAVVLGLIALLALVGCSDSTDSGAAPSGAPTTGDNTAPSASASAPTASEPSASTSPSDPASSPSGSAPTDPGTSTAPSDPATTEPPTTDPTSEPTTEPTSKPTNLETVAPVKEITRPVVPLEAPAPFGNGVTVKVTKTTYGKVTDEGPGVLTGRPTVTFVLTMTNKSAAKISLDTVQVSATHGEDATPATPANASTLRPFSGALAPGKSATAQYAFAIPVSEQHQVKLTVWYAEGEPTVVMAGSAR